MARLIQKGDALNYTNSTNAVISAGTVVAAGYMIGVVINDIKPGETGALALRGVWEVDKVKNKVFSKGDAVYWKSNKATDDDSGVFMGFAWESAANNSTTVRVKFLADVAGGKGPQSTGGGESGGNPVTYEYVDGIGQGVAPEYESDTEYEEGDCVYYVGKFYKRTSSGSGAGVSPSDPTNGATYWTEIVLSDELLNRLEAASGSSASVSQGQTPGLVWVDTSVGLTISGGADATPLEPAGKLSIDLPALAGLLEQYLNGTTAVGTEPLPGGEETEDVYLSFVSQDAMESYVASQFEIPAVPTTYGYNNYEVGDVVEYNGSYYRCITGVNAAVAQMMSITPVSALGESYWEPYEYDPNATSAFKVASDIVLAQAFDTAFHLPVPWVSGNSYSAGDLVSYGNGIYKRTNANPGDSITAPSSTNNPLWQAVTWSYGNVVVGLMGVPEFQIGHSYQNELVEFKGIFYAANGSLAVAPNEANMWPTTTPFQFLLDKIGESSGTKNRAIENAVNGTITLVGNGGAVNIGFDTTTPNIVHQQTVSSGNNFDMAVWGHNIVEFDVIYTNAQAATALTWNGSAVTWIKGSATDLTAGRHLLRFRLIPQLDLNVPGAILVEYLCELPASF